jgi:hypothetical protein
MQTLITIATDIVILKAVLLSFLYNMFRLLPINGQNMNERINRQ